MSRIKASTVNEYFKLQPPAQRAALKLIRKTIIKAAPQAEEVISYGMPAFKFQGMLLYYAGFNAHYSLFPYSSAIRKFKNKLSAYETSAGTIKFRLDQKVPVKLITQIVKFRVKENVGKKMLKEMRKK